MQRASADFPLHYDELGSEHGGDCDTAATNPLISSVTLARLCFTSVFNSRKTVAHFETKRDRDLFSANQGSVPFHQQSTDLQQSDFNLNDCSLIAQNLDCRPSSAPPPTLTSQTTSMPGSRNPKRRLDRKINIGSRSRFSKVVLSIFYCFSGMDLFFANNLLLKSGEGLMREEEE
ncbi:hypothetical protein MRB53_032278 [Persea americana]|uniref:Uncharacterized protein n=1 Tax=Persea americana TaxID=3435 RepID=A0ACC2KRN3_PERAE|nr:hypothetical protein MRB53_032278 [Persea americana]